MATRLERIRRHLALLNRDELLSVGNLAWGYLCAQPRVWRWWFELEPLVLG